MKIERILEQIISFPVFWIIAGIPTSVHLGMTKEDERVEFLKKATYREIKDKILSTDWSYGYFNKLFKNALFTQDYSAYLHAGIYRFDNVGYLLTPYGYFRTYFLRRKLWNKLVKINKPYVK